MKPYPIVQWSVAALILFLACSMACWAAVDNTMPASPVKLVFIHHSTGGNWLADANTEQPYGGLGTALKNNNYYVSATNYGWGPGGIGNNTDIPHWPDWFTAAGSETVLSALYSETGQNVGGYGNWSRMSTDPGGGNVIVLFKSCYPNSDLFGNPTDPAAPTPDGSYTVSNAKAVYNTLLTYFQTRTDKLFVVITAPPQNENDYGADIQTASQRAANARAFNNWLVHDWLSGYPHDNVAVFDYFNVLTGVNNHHRWHSSSVQHVIDGSNNFSAYPNGEWDSHPGTAGQQKATTELIGLLNYYYNRWQAGQGDITYSLYFPHIAVNTAYDTRLCIVNTSNSQSLTGTLIAYDHTGAQISTTPLFLPAMDRRNYTVRSEFITPEEIGYMILESGSASVCGYMKFYVESRFRGAIPATSHINTQDIPIPHIASNASWWTGISLVNTTGTSKMLTLEFNNGITRTRTIAAGAHHVFSIKSLFSQISQPAIKSGIIRNAAGIIGLELFGSHPGSADSYLSGVLLKDTTASSLYYPHVASQDKWWTGIVAFNPSASTATLTITPYQADGTALTSQTMDLPGSAKYIGTAGLLGFPAGTAWFSILSTQPLCGFELFGTHNRNQLGGYSIVNISRTRGVFPEIEPAGWTGIALVNTEPATATVTLTAYNNNGDAVAVQPLVLGPHEKAVGLVETIFTADISAATYVAFSSDRAIAGFQLNGSSDGMMLDALPGM